MDFNGFGDGAWAQTIGFKMENIMFLLWEIQQNHWIYIRNHKILQWEIQQNHWIYIGNHKILQWEIHQNHWIYIGNHEILLWEIQQNQARSHEGAVACCWNPRDRII